jgi:hypothetical protein
MQIFHVIVVKKSHLVCQLTLINNFCLVLINYFTINLELHGCVILLSAVGVGQYNTSMQFKVPQENILVFLPQSHGIFA